jgi:hypothetical protein
MSAIPAVFTCVVDSSNGKNNIKVACEPCRNAMIDTYGIVSTTRRRNLLFVGGDNISEQWIILRDNRANKLDRKTSGKPFLDKFKPPAAIKDYR